ncbi:uncharacterized protein LOC133203529 [Saccostrea echinata]|uniref:uncharacterized protein LOC133203529 n=1 Tax=Saccostrea echinata TaxID=191078 RepID=UPI002A80AFEE|nr:uncharacterized protein LOC133203529 [Saccostrea echinata]
MNTFISGTFFFVFFCHTGHLQRNGHGNSIFQNQARFPRCTSVCSSIPLSTPRHCISNGRLYWFRGRFCRGCDWVRSGCANTCNGVNCATDNSPPYCYRNCPYISRGMPRHCIIPGAIVNNQGFLCRLCDRIQPTCSRLASRFIPRCPVRCKEVMNGTPEHCITRGRVMNYRGRPCRLCDTVDFGCVRKGLSICAEALETCKTAPKGMPDFCISQNITSTPATPPCLTCPIISNSSMCRFPPCQRCTPLTNITTVPPECIKDGDIVQIPGYHYRCSLCPYIDPFCSELEVTICGNQMANCVGTPVGTPQRCIDQSVHIFLGSPCLSCPILKTEEPGCVKEAYDICSGFVCPRVTRQTVMCFDKGPFSNAPNATCKTCPILHRHKHNLCATINSYQRF